MDRGAQLEALSEDVQLGVSHVQRRAIVKCMRHCKEILYDMSIEEMTSLALISLVLSCQTASL